MTRHLLVLTPLSGNVNQPHEVHRKKNEHGDWEAIKLAPDPVWRLELDDLLWAVASPAGDEDDYARVVHALLIYYPEGEPTLEAAFALGGKEALRAMVIEAITQHGAHDTREAPRVVSLGYGDPATVRGMVTVATTPREDGRRLTAPDGTGNPNAPRFPLPVPSARKPT